MATTTRTPPRLMTAEQFYDFVHRPENIDQFFELDDGEVIELTRPKRLHGIVCGLITALLVEYSRRTGRGQVCPNDTGILLGRDPDVVRGPDVAYFAERLSLEQAGAEDGFTEEIPLLVVEVLSPSDRPGRIARKIDQYLRAGVRLVWLVDPEIREVTVYRPSAPPEIVAGDEILRGGDELPGFDCRAVEVFDLPGDATPPA